MKRPCPIGNDETWHDREFLLDDISVCYGEDDLRKLVERRGFTPDGGATLWGRGFISWYYSGGRESHANERREFVLYLRAVEEREADIYLHDSAHRLEMTAKKLGAVIKENGD